jgi:parallel beta-helix repeat protein
VGGGARFGCFRVTAASLLLPSGSSLVVVVEPAVRILSLIAATCAGLAVVGSAGGQLSSGSAPVAPPNPFPPPLAASRGPTHFVSPSGADTNPGSRRRPWRTIQKAASALRPGESAIVLPGTYVASITLARSGSRSRPITLRGTGGARPVVVGRLKISGDWVRVSGFVFTSDPSSGAEEPAIYVQGGRHIELSRNEIQGAHRSGIFVSDARDVQILANYIHDNGTSPRLDHGIYFSGGDGGLIANNLIVGNKAYGIQLYPHADYVIATQNTISDNGRGGIVLGGDSHESSGHTLIVNNIIAFNTAFGIRTHWSKARGKSNVARMNLLFGDGQADLDLEGLASMDNVIADPRFVDRAARDYRLADDSPAFGRAVPDFSMVLDLTGHRRPVPSALGAFDRG